MNIYTVDFCRGGMVFHYVSVAGNTWEEAKERIREVFAKVVGKSIYNYTVKNALADLEIMKEEDVVVQEASSFAKIFLFNE